MSISLTFRPPLWATLAWIVACSLFVSAGLWQLGRMGEKRALFASFDAAGDQSLVAAPENDQPWPELRYRRVQLTGKYDAERQILLDNMVNDGQVGYQVLTPLITADGTAVLVNRGWVPAAADRSRLPDVVVAGGRRSVTGRLDRLPRPGLRLDPEPLPADAPWPRRLLFPTATDIASQAGYPVSGYQVLLDPDAPDGFRREWRPDIAGPETHLSYAVQWFAFTAAVTVIYLALNLKKTT